MLGSLFLPHPASVNVAAASSMAASLLCMADGLPCRGRQPARAARKEKGAAFQSGTRPLLSADRQEPDRLRSKRFALRPMTPIRLSIPGEAKIHVQAKSA